VIGTEFRTTGCFDTPSTSVRVPGVLTRRELHENGGEARQTPADTAAWQTALGAAVGEYCTITITDCVGAGVPE